MVADLKPVDINSKQRLALGCKPQTEISTPGAMHVGVVSRQVEANKLIYEKLGPGDKNLLGPVVSSRLIGVDSLGI